MSNGDDDEESKKGSKESNNNIDAVSIKCDMIKFDEQSSYGFNNEI